METAATDPSASVPRRFGARIAAIAILGMALVAAALLLTRPRPGRTEIVLHGTTVDGTGAPLPDVEISLEIVPAESEGELPVEHVSTRSDSRGRFILKCRVPWQEPSYSVEASKPGFETVAIDDADELPNPLTLRLAASRP